MIQTATAHTERSQHTDGFIRIEDELWYRIAAYSDMEPFFMSIISPDDLWMYISSTGGLTAGRAEADSAIFPYYTHDRVTENHTNTGSHTMIRVSEGSRTIVWEPFASFVPQQEGVERILYKHAAGNRIRFVERNTRLGLQFSYCWSSSPSWGWVRSVALENLDGSPKQITILDGVRNLLPSFVSKKLQNDLGNLVDAYKLNELHGSALALYGLSSRISDKAEASESLQVSTAWQQGLPSVQYLISERQCEQFRSTGGVTEELRIEGRRGAYYAHSQFTLASVQRSGGSWCWKSTRTRTGCMSCSMSLQTILMNSPVMCCRTSRWPQSSCVTSQGRPTGCSWSAAGPAPSITMPIRCSTPCGEGCS